MEHVELETHSAIDAIANKIRDTYILCARRATNNPDYGSRGLGKWDGREDRWGRSHSPIWPTLASFVVEHGLDPADFVQAQFTAGDTGRVPLPSTFTSENALDRYRRNAENAEIQAERVLDCGMSSIKCQVRLLMDVLGWEYNRAIDGAVHDIAMVKASPLVRYCVAVREGVPDVSPELRERALLEYICRAEVLDKVWGDFIPVDLRQEARSVISNLR